VTSTHPIEKLDPSHDLAHFDCGKEPLNRFLQRYALANQHAHTAQTYVLCQHRQVVGYYSLTVGAVTHEQAPQRVRKGLARHAIPVILLARLAVDLRVARQGFGAALLRDALLRTASAADTVGARALLVHAKDDEAKAFYQHFDFDPSPSDPYHLFLIMKDQ
jgi:GNAT superfamily N-acetyltransferase